MWHRMILFLEDFHTLQSVLSLLYFFISSLNGFLYGVNSFVHAASNGFLTNEIEGYADDTENSDYDCPK